MTLSDYEIEIKNCSLKESESVFQKIADSYENDLLKFDIFPDDHFNFFLRLLSEKQFYSKPGLWNFLLVVGTEKHKLSSIHYNRIADSILCNYLHYQDENLCLAVCDFIARNFEQNEAEKLLLKLKEIDAQKAMQGFANDGLRILSNEKKRIKYDV